MFSKVVIANRGEIACRIIHTLKKLKIQSIAIYSKADQQAMHTQLADEAYLIENSEEQTKNNISYLAIDEVIKIAKQCNADAIHPGYGFLSENPSFASACTNANIIFIGPSSKIIEQMGVKSQAKKIMEAAGIPAIPGYHGQSQETQDLLAKAIAIGFPILIKADHGGGGKGMRIVTCQQDFLESLESCKREANNSFGFSTIILEKYIQNPRHIEIQIFADNHGNVVHLFERDCSIQRRHQKIIEEAPASAIPESITSQMADISVNAIKSIGYSGAGTLEFLVDQQNNFYFMEMNTRLQVEHPVTEMITKLDLVEWQILVAANKQLPLTQSQINKHGHAIEARIYAEDPTNDFLPSTGKIINYKTCPKQDNIRLDHSLQKLDQISIHYDPLLAKLIVLGTNREDAIAVGKAALQKTHIGGVNTNLSLLRKIFENDTFKSGNLSTSFITNNQATLLDASTTQAEIALIFAAFFIYIQCGHTFCIPPGNNMQDGA